MTDLTQTPLRQQAVSERPTDWSQTLAFSQFDPSLGTLQSIGVGATADVAGSVSAESLEAAPSTVSATLNSNVAVNSPIGVPLASVAASATNSANLAAYDGSADYAGRSGTALALTGTASTSANWQQGGTPLGDFVGTGSVQLAVNDTTRLDVSGPANLQFSAHASGGAVVTLQYSYAPSSGSGSGSVSTSGSGLTDVTFPVLASGEVTTVLQTFTFADATTGWSSSVPVSRFDSALGTLQAVNLTLSANILASVAAQDQDATASDIATTQTATVALGALLSAAPTASDLMSLAGGADRIDQGLTQTASNSVTLTDARDLAAFTGPGTYSVPISATGASSLDGPGNMLAKLLAEAGATVTVSYTYQPNVPTSDVTWSNAAGGAWEDAGNWSSPPGSNADIAITTPGIFPGIYTIDVNRAESVHSVLIDAPGATVVLNGNLTTAGDFVLDAGTLEFNGGTLSVGNFTENGGVISGEAVDIQAAGTVALANGSAVASGAILQVAGAPITTAAASVAVATDALDAGNVVLSPLALTDASLSGVAAAPPDWFIHAISDAASAAASTLADNSLSSILNSQAVSVAPTLGFASGDFAVVGAGIQGPASQTAASDQPNPFLSAAGLGAADPNDAFVPSLSCDREGGLGPF